jgi:hypothetical protein
MLWRIGITALFAALATLTALPAAAAEQIVDNSDGAVQVKGTWTATSTTSGFQGSNYLFHTAGDGLSTVTWPFPGGGAGKYEVFARWSSGPNRASNATYQITSNSGTNNVSQNQKANGGTWQSLGTFDFEPGKKQGVTLSDKADGVVAADAVRFVGPNGPAASPTPTPAATPQPSQQSAVVPAPTPAPAQAVARFFSQTGYRISEDKFWDYLRGRGCLRREQSDVAVIIKPRQRFVERVARRDVDQLAAVLARIDVTEHLRPHLTVERARHQVLDDVGV